MPLSKCAVLVVLPSGITLCLTNCVSVYAVKNSFFPFLSSKCILFGCTGMLSHQGSNKLQTALKYSLEV